MFTIMVKSTESTRKPQACNSRKTKLSNAAFLKGPNILNFYIMIQDDMLRYKLKKHSEMTSKLDQKYCICGHFNLWPLVYADYVFQYN